jgi:hypothetical protein
VNLLTPILDIAASLLGIARRRNEDKNAPDVKAAAKAQQEVDQEGKETKAVAEQDADAVRKGLSE